MANAPQFFLLDHEECIAVLERNHVGRIAYREGKQVSIQPVGYVARGEWLFLRSAYGSKLEAISRDPFVAFEVDEIEGPFDWRSVVVRGTIYMLSGDGSPVEQQEARRAMEAIRAVMPGAFTERDPVAERQVIYGLHATDVTGRMATSSRPSTLHTRVTPPSPSTVRKPSDSF